MIPHIKQTLEEIEAKISALQTLAAGLRQHFGVPEPAEPASVRIRGNGVPRTSRKLRGGAPGAVETARHIKEPFAASDLAEAAGLSYKNAGNYIMRWKA